MTTPLSIDNIRDAVQTLKDMNEYIFNDVGVTMQLFGTAWAALPPYEPWWDNWPCHKCKTGFTTHNRETYECHQTGAHKLDWLYFPMDKLDYLELQYDKSK